MTDTKPMVDAYTFLGIAFCRLCSRPTSPLTWKSRPLLVLLNARQCECLWRDLALLFFGYEGFGKLSEDNSSSVGVSASSRMTSAWSGAVLARHLERLIRHDCVFSLHEPEDDRFHATGAQPDPPIPSSSLLVPLASSPYLDANEGTGLWATKSLDCSTL